MQPSVRRNCTQCGREFVVYQCDIDRGARKEFCSLPCYWKSRAASHPPCVVCKQPTTGSRTKFCSLKCRSQYATGRPLIARRRRISKTCPTCNKQFEVGGRLRHPWQIFCSSECMGKARRTPLTGKIDHHRVGNASWREKRREILNRDGEQCGICSRRTNLQVHHIVPQDVVVDHSDSNLISVCRRCHQALDAITRIGYEVSPGFDPNTIIRYLKKHI
jgi:hypothetical protein